jgi:hypothetical protein
MSRFLTLEIGGDKIDREEFLISKYMRSRLKIEYSVPNILFIFRQSSITYRLCRVGGIGGASWIEWAL